MAMFCTKCGAALEPGTRFCTSCGAPVQEPAAPVTPVAETPVEEEVKAVPVEPTPVQVAPTPVEPTPVQVTPAPVQPTPVQVAPTPVQPAPVQVQYVPVQPVQQAPVAAPTEEVAGVGRFFWSLLLFSIPVVGFIFSIIFSFAPRNRSFKNFSRAMMIWNIIALVIGIVTIVLISLFSKNLSVALNW